MNKKIDLSVIILSYNTKNFLKQCLESALKAKENGFNYQLIVVDNASIDDSVVMIKKNFPQLELIESRKNLGYAGGNNLGLKKAKGKYVLFLNSDTQVKPSAFVKIIRFMEKNPRVGAATPKTMLFSGKMDPDCHRGFPTPWASISYFLGLEGLFPKSKIFGQYHQFYKNLNQPHQIDAGFGTFMVVRKKVIDQVGAWDEGYFFYGEDLDYFYRIKAAGWQVMFYSEPLLLHHKGGSSGLRKESRKVTPASRETRIKTARASMKAMERFYQKFYQGKYPAWVTWLVVSGIRLKGSVRILCHWLRRN